jgi:hypothetical protein
VGRPPTGRAVPGRDVPDHRGRVGLDRPGRCQRRKHNVVVRDVELLASGWYALRSTSLDCRHSDGRLDFYAAPDTEQTMVGVGCGVADEGEDIEVVEPPFEFALDMVHDGRVADAKTIMLLQWAALDGRFAAHQPTELTRHERRR